jgi:hypothetical protein
MTLTLRRVRTMPCATLLVVQLLGVLLYPFMEGAEVGRALFSLFGLVVLALAVVAVRSTPALTWVSLTIGLPVVVLTVLEAINPDSTTISLWSGVLHALFYFYTTYGLISYMFADDWVTRDELYATGAAFTVAAWAFAYVYGVVQIIWPGSFTAALDPEAPRTWMELLYLSFTTMTSVGLSDITPILPNARSFVMIEQVAGVMYVALVVARLVGLTIARFRR